MDSRRMKLQRNRFTGRCKIVGFAVILAIIAAVCWLRVRTDPGIVYLQPEIGARWIRFDRPFALRRHGPGKITTEFRKILSLETVPPEAVLTVRSLKQASVFLDGKQIHRPHNERDEWKKPELIALGPHLSPESHELRIVVLNHNGPSVLLAYSKSLNLFTGTDWEARQAEGDWSPALPVNQPAISPALIGHFSSSSQAVIKHAALLLLVFSLVFLGTLLHAHNSALPSSYQRVCRFSFKVGSIRWCLMGLWFLLSINNLLKGLAQGFDYVGHLEYIDYMTEHYIPPLATDGWQMFQPPLYYVVSAALYKLFMGIWNPEISERLLQIVPLFCGLAQIELCFRALKYTFPQRYDLQGFPGIEL